MQQFGKTQGLGGREYVSIILIAIGIRITDVSSIVVMNKVENAAWMVPILSLLISLPLFWLAYRVIRDYPGMHLLQVSERVLGRVGGIGIGIILFGIIAFTFTIEVRGFADSLAALYYPRTPLIILIAVVLIGAIFGSIRGLDALGSAFYICMPYLKMALLFLALLMTNYADLNRMFPLLGSGVPSILRESALSTTIFSDLFLMLLFIPFLRAPKRFFSLSIVSSVIVALELALFFWLYLIFFSYPFAVTLSSPFHEVTTYVSLGEYFSHVETFFLYMQIIAICLKFSLYIYLLAFLFGAVFRISQFEKIVVPLGMLVFLLALIPENPASYGLPLRTWFHRLSSLFYLAFPLLLWATHAIRRRART